MTAASVELGQALLALLPVAVGGLIATLGAVATPIVSHWLKHGADRKAKRIERFEAMVGAVYEHDHWLDQTRQHRMFGSTAPELPSPLSKASVIASIYFPEFTSKIHAVDLAARKFGIWTYQAAMRRLHNKVETMNEGMLEAYAPYRDLFAQLIIDFESYAEKRLSQ